MKAFQRKRNIQNTHHDIQPVQAQFQSRPFAEPQAETKSVSENTSSLQSGNSKPGFNFAEIPLYPTQPQVTAPVQPKFTFAQAKLESGIVQRSEEEEEPQAKLESGIVQRSEEEEVCLRKSCKGWIGKNRTQVIQNKIREYNAILKEDKDYKTQQKILNRIDHKTRKWLEQHKDDKRAPRLSQLLTEVVKEGTEVKIQKAKSSQGYVDKLKQNVVGDKAVEGINAGATAYGAVKASGALTPDNQMTFGQQTKSLVEGVNESVNQGSNLTSTEKIANLSQNYADIVKASPVAALGGSVVSLLMSIYNLVDSYSILSALGSSAKNLGVLKEVENTEPEQEKDSLVLAYEALEINRSGKSTDNNQELQKSTKYGYAKVKRRFFGAIYDVISNIVNIVGQILTVTGVGALVGAIISTGTKVIDLVTLTIRKIKGLYKILTGKRGVKRQLSAETIVQDALNGNGEALNLLVKLDPLGVAGRRIVGILKVKDLKGIKKPETQDQMKEFLIQIKKGKLGSITLSDFITAVAEQLKSF
ncbi:hypothetical protein [Planktothrix agardhii]|uniref:hypothetical protein n=1 Tax=Planktothrix agardhii TaxID=1160 RepID=UPI001D0A73DB|nr:hypothetical protein [Planktothrix agardhii]MCB8751169.1 hypothetical protein [Planktothrix agardhii 1810]